MEQSLSVSVTVSLGVEGKKERGKKKESSQDFTLNFRIRKGKRVSVLYASGKEDKKNH